MDLNSIKFYYDLQIYTSISYLSLALYISVSSSFI